MQEASADAILKRLQHALGAQRQALGERPVMAAAERGDHEIHLNEDKQAQSKDDQQHGVSRSPCGLTGGIRTLMRETACSRITDL